MLNTLLIEPTKSGAAGAPFASRADSRDRPSSGGSSFESHVRQQETRETSKAAETPQEKPEETSAAEAPDKGAGSVPKKTESAESEAASAEEAGGQPSGPRDMLEETPAMPPEILPEDALQVPEGAVQVSAEAIQAPADAVQEPADAIPEPAEDVNPVPAAAPEAGSREQAPRTAAELAAMQKTAAAPAAIAGKPARQPGSAAAAIPAEEAARPAPDPAMDTAPAARIVAPEAVKHAAAPAARGSAAAAAPPAPEADPAGLAQAGTIKGGAGVERMRAAPALPAATAATAMQMTQAMQAAPAQPLAAGEAAKAAMPAAGSAPEPEAELEAGDVKVTESAAPAVRQENSWRATAPVPQPAAQVPMTASGLAMQMALAETGAETAAATLLSGEILGGEATGLSQLLTEAIVAPGTVHRPEVPRMVAQQMAEAVAAKGDRNIEIALSPEELGRVKMRLSATETGVSVMITTERPETGDLMRKHINELAEEFRRMGYEDVSFEFSGESAQDGGGDGGDASAGGSGLGGRGGSGAAKDAAGDLPIQQTLRLGETGLDMRM